MPSSLQETVTDAVDPVMVHPEPASLPGSPVTDHSTTRASPSGSDAVAVTPELVPSGLELCSGRVTVGGRFSLVTVILTVAVVEAPDGSVTE